MFAYRSLRCAPVTALLFSLFSLGMAAESASQAIDPAAEPASQAIDAAAEARPRVPGRPGSGPDTLPDAAQIIDEKGQRLRVTPLKGLERPWALAFLPDGAMLVTERPG
ncbi:MAG: PQQ-dependent sugar dehydrogenase, partial [Rhodospirillaceae bacterium]|nr:PQQ-dependent sugar dehydrogenase [Rhodospirillaceae bacterium]